LRANKPLSLDVSAGLLCWKYRAYGRPENNFRDDRETTERLTSRNNPTAKGKLRCSFKKRSLAHEHSYKKTCHSAWRREFTSPGGGIVPRSFHDYIF
jgi:hypothetical protein